MSNKVLFGKEARAKLKAGIDIVFKTVAPTLGANGRNMVWNKWTRIPIISNDGVSGAREIEPEDLGELQGANLIKQVSERTNDEAGDGTTTSIILAHAIIDEGMKLIDSDAKINPMKLRREITEATDKVLTALKESAIPVTSLEALENVATISVESKEIGKTIAEAIYNAGDDGIVYVNDSQEIGVTIEKTDGYQIHQGLITPYLITRPERMETVLNNPAILITDMQLTLNDNFINLIQNITAKTKDILVFCDEIHPDVIKFAVGNLTKGIFKMAIVKKPLQANYLEDIAALVGGTVMTAEKGKVKYNSEFLGTCEKVVVNQKTTTIFGGQGAKNYIMSDTAKSTLDVHIENLKSQIELAEDEPSKTKMKERLAKLTGGVFMLNVGDKTEAETKYLRMKVDDAVSATKAAKEEGIVAGGGMALFKISSMFGANMNHGESIIYRACLEPLKTIIENSGEDYTDIFNQVNNSNKGFNALTLKVVPDMIEEGIIDPVKVTRNALANASSFAGLLLTVETLIIPNPEKQDKSGLVN